jgi:hypothetical protein
MECRGFFSLKEPDSGGLLIIPNGFICGFRVLMAEELKALPVLYYMTEAAGKNTITVTDF